MHQKQVDEIVKQVEKPTVLPNAFLEVRGLDMPRLLT